MHRLTLWLRLISYSCATLLVARPVCAAEIFAPGIVSTAAPEFAISLTADGNTLFFNRASDDRSQLLILTSQRHADGSWSSPVPVPFTGEYRDVDPFVTAGGTRLFYSSNRPAPGEEGAGDFDLWVVDRGEEGAWGVPRNLGAPVNTSATEIFSTVARNGNLYFRSDRDGEDAIYRARAIDGGYGEPERLVLGGVASTGGNPAIAPDERTLVFVSEGEDGQGGPDLYVSQHRDGAWTTPRPLSAPVNSPFADFAPHVSWDGAYLYWTSDRPGVVPAGAVQGRPPGDVYRTRWEELGLRAAARRR